MKKILCLVSAAFLVLSSCSSDSDSAKESSILVKKVIYTYQDGTTTSDVSYNGNKITKITDSDGEFTTYTYTGDVVTKRESFYEDGSLNYSTQFIYTSGKLSEILKKEGSDSKFNYKTKYTHNADGTIAYEDFRVNIATGVEEEYGFIGKYTYANGNLVKEEKSFYGSDSVITHEYDTKNTPFKNVTGFSLLIGEESSSSNNVVKSTFNSKGSSTPSSEAYIFEYDSKNYPTKITTNTQAGTSVIVETTEFVY
ncbi:hypothetical protein [Flavobacterium hercynium]|uniref:DUF4595 domain-containing protein n=1 Tax=Flavobacterium hercynium TaxID=387094 RepID=A0A226HIH9_9FLAO|nr:hypothetical protein [Flavobacterium hercynium]OXA93975.1 hypothetical protein B0A66_05600 [Flavobacterium hercynium]SMP36618.1 YD repeat-containing protein [Flavobacterium hercynium]